MDTQDDISVHIVADELRRVVRDIDGCRMSESEHREKAERPLERVAKLLSRRDALVNGLTRLGANALADAIVSYNMRSDF